MPSQYFGWDLGGAHIKVVELDARGTIVAVDQRPCPLWTGVATLRDALLALRREPASSDALHAVTMTGELCDVFPHRAAGVQEIVSCFRRVFDSDAVLVYGGYAGWLSVEQAMASSRDVASANWLALATLMAEQTANGIVLDVGSTTSDVVLICMGEVRCEGRDDASRLARDELIYTGVVRTPVMAICDRVPYAGSWQNIAAENFATMADVYRVTGALHEEDDQMPTADGRGKGRADSARRLARMLGRDYEDQHLAAIRRVADYIASCQVERLRRAIACVMSRMEAGDAIDTLVGAGAGAFVAERIAREIGVRFVDFSALIGSPPALARRVRNCAPAACLAKLAWMTQ